MQCKSNCSDPVSYNAPSSHNKCVPFVRISYIGPSSGYKVNHNNTVCDTSEHALVNNLEDKQINSSKKYLSSEHSFIEITCQICGKRETLNLVRAPTLNFLSCSHDCDVYCTFDFN